MTVTITIDRDRYSYEGLYHADRLEKPMVRIGNEWQEVDWQTALEAAMREIQKVLNNHGNNELAALASPNSTLEEFYLLQKLVRGVGSSNVDHRLRQVDFRDQDQFPLYPGLNEPIADLDQNEVIVLIGSDIQREQPLLSLRIRKAALKGAQVVVVNMMDYDFHFKVATKKIAAPHEFAAAVATVMQDAALAFPGKKMTVLLGAQALNHPQAAHIRSLASAFAKQTGATFGLLTEGSNAAGAWLAGAVPHRGVAGQAVEKGLDAKTMWEKPCKGYLLLNVEPDLDCANPVAAVHALEQADCIVALTSFRNPILEQYAHVLLPVAPFTETSGTFVNVEGHRQSFKGVATAVGDSRPAWKVLRVLANFLHCEGFDYSSSEEVRDEVFAAVGSNEKPHSFSQVESSQRETDEVLSRIGSIPIYSGDNLVRRAKALQATQPIIEGNLAAVRLHPKTAEQLQLKEADNVIVKQQEERIRLPIILDRRVPVNAAYLAGGIALTSGLSQLFGSIEIHKA